MTDTSKSFSMDWRIALGFTLTVIWIGAGMIYLLVIVGWSNFVYLPTADIGSFLEGVPEMTRQLQSYRAEDNSAITGALLFYIRPEKLMIEP